MIDVIGIGTAFVDYYFETDESFLRKYNLATEGVFWFDENLTLSSFLSELPLLDKNAGGICANTLSVLRHLGMSVSYAGVIGDDAEGDFWLESIGNVGESYVVRAGKMSQCACILTDNRKHRTFVSELNPQDNEIFKTLTANVINTARIVHIAQLELEHDKTFFMLEQVVRKAQVPLISFSPGLVYISLGFNTLASFFSKTHVLFLNEQEMQVLTNEAYKKGAAKLLEAGVKIVACTRAEKGAYIATHEKEIEVPAVRVEKIVDATCAGDTFAAGFLYGILHNKPLEWASQFATRLAALALTDFGLKAIKKERIQTI